MKNKLARRDFADTLIKETVGLKKNEMSLFIGALISNLSHNLPEEVGEQVIASFKESRETVKDIVSDFSAVYGS